MEARTRPLHLVLSALRACLSGNLVLIAIGNPLYAATALALPNDRMLPFVYRFLLGVLLRA